MYSGSVIIGVTITAKNQSAAQEVTAVLSTKLSSLTSTQEFMAAAVPDIVVTSTPDVETVEEDVIVAPPPPAWPNYGHYDGLDGGAIAGIVIGSLIGAGLIGGAIFAAVQQQSKKSPSEPAGVTFSNIEKSGEQDNI